LRTLARPDASTMEFAAGTEVSTGAPRTAFAVPEAPQAPLAPQVAPPAVAPAVPQGYTTPGGPTMVPFGGIAPVPTQPEPPLLPQ
jgi:hypothetical protein